MAIHDAANNNQAAPTAAAPSLTTGPVTHQPQQPEAPRTWSFHQKGVFKVPVSAGIGGEYFTKTRAALTEIYKDLTDELKVSILSLNRQNYPQLRFSALIVACELAEQGNNVLAYHTLILEGTGEELGAVTRQVDNQNIQVNRVTSDAFDLVMQELVQKEVQSEFQNKAVYAADAMVLPRHVDHNNKEILENVARNAALACVSVINTVNDSFGKLDLTLMDRDARFTIDVTFGNHQVHSVIGEPQRSSTLLSYNSHMRTAQSIQNQYNAVNIADSVARICEVSGFIQPIWAPMDNTGGIGFGSFVNPSTPHATQKFAAEFVVTSLRTDYATSPAAVLLALSSSLALVDQDTWIQGLLPRGTRTRHTSDQVDITDIGALNITANLANEAGGFGRPIDVASMKGDLTQISKYLVSIFRPGLIVSLDCPEAASQSWYMSIFAAAASGDRAAQDQILQSANELTGGTFGKIWNAHGEATPIFSNIIRVPLGYYKVDDQEQDLRNIDYTAIANMYQNNPQMIHEYSNTFVERPGVSPARNLAIRENILREVLSQGMKITGYAARVSFSDTFIQTLSQAIRSCNLPVSVNTPLNADQLRSGTPTPAFVNQSLAHNTHTYQAGGYGVQRPVQQYRYHGGRVY